MIVGAAIDTDIVLVIAVWVTMIRLRYQHTCFNMKYSPVELYVSFVDWHKLTQSNGKQIAFGPQHELIMHTDVFDEQWYVALLHGSRIEHKLAGAQ